MINFQTPLHPSFLSPLSRPSLFAMVVVGSPSRGLVGIGRGRGDAAPVAMDSAFQRAVLSMDHVDKFEGRTLWGAGKDLRSKWGSTEVIMRGRPAGESTFTIISLVSWSCNLFTNLDLLLCV
jgi:hypothetical protein